MMLLETSILSEIQEREGREEAIVMGAKTYLFEFMKEDR